MKENSRAAWTLSAFVGIYIVLCFFWPAWRTVVGAVQDAALHPWLRKANLPSKGETRSPDSELARYAESMEFRIRHYPTDPSQLKQWNAEWTVTPSHKEILLRIMLQRLPAVISQKEPSRLENFKNSVQPLIDEGKAGASNNAFFTLSQSLLLEYPVALQKGSPPEEPPWFVLKRDASLEQMDSGLRALNFAERALWREEKKSWVLFPAPPRIRGYDLETPLFVLSREIMAQERNALKKYNIELALDLAMLHLQLSHWILEGSWTAEDLATSRAIANRAMDPFMTHRDSHPTPVQLEENFSNFLDEHGNPTQAAKFHAWLMDLNNREKTIAMRLPQWRWAQQFAYWNVSGVLVCLFTQATSLSLAWLVVIFSGPPPQKKKNGDPVRSRISLALLAFSAAPLGWAFTNWPPGGLALLFSLGGSWVLWYLTLTWGQPEGRTPEWRPALAATAVSILAAAFLFTLVVSYLFQWRARQLELILQQGWLTG